MAAFVGDEEWLETLVDHPVSHLRRTIVFPPERPCRLAELENGASQTRLLVQRGRNGATTVTLKVFQPLAHHVYTASTGPGERQATRWPGAPRFVQCSIRVFSRPRRRHAWPHLHSRNQRLAAVK